MAKNENEVGNMTEKEIPGKLEYFEGRLCEVKDARRSGWWRFNEHYDRDGYFVHTVNKKRGTIARENPSQGHYVMVRFDRQKFAWFPSTMNMRPPTRPGI